MGQWRTVFVSAVTAELGSFRTAVRDVLQSMDVKAVVEEHFPTEYREIHQILAEKIAQCDAVVCLVGFCFGSEPRDRPEGRRRRSYTQLEYDIARSLGKPVYLFLTDGRLPADRSVEEDQDKRQLQQQHRAQLMASDQIRYGFGTLVELHKLVAGIPVRARWPLKTFARALPSAAEVLFGRGEDLRRLEQIWFDPHIHVAQVVAWGGAGKTSLIARWLKDLPAKDWLGAERVFVWPFHGGMGTGPNLASAEDFVARALEFFGADAAVPGGSPFDKGERLAEMVKRYRSLLVLDGLESLQHPPGPSGGQLRDPGLKMLLQGLAAGGRGLCIVTTRASVQELNQWRESSAPEWSLEKLDDEAGASLLSRAGVRGPDEELRAASTETEGHALTLELLGRFLAGAHGGDVRKRGLVKLSDADRRLHGGRAFQVMKAYEEWLDSSGEEGRRQLDLLRLLSLFDGPADPPCLAALRREPPIAGLADALLAGGPEDFNLAVSHLTKAGLVHRLSWEATPIRGFTRKAAELAQQTHSLGDPDLEEVPWETSSEALDSHPLVREYFARRARDEAPEAWRAGHQRLYEHLIGSVPYWPEGLEGLQLLYRAIVHGCEAGQHLEACANVYRDRIQRNGYGEGYSITVLGAASADLSAVTCFFEIPWTRVHPSLPPPAAAWVLRDAAFSLEYVGRLAEALEPLDTSLQMLITAQQWSPAASRSNDLSRLQLLLGRIGPATKSARQTIDFAQRAGHGFWQVIGRTTLAQALACAGKPEEALAFFQSAEDLQRNMARNRTDEPLFSLQGFQYCEQLLAPVERAAWQGLNARRAPGEAGLAGASRPADELRADDFEVLRDVEQRARFIIEVADQERWSTDKPLGWLLLSQTILYRALLSPAVVPTPTLKQANEWSNTALEAARSAGGSQYLVKCLLCRALVHWLSRAEEAAAADLRAAWDIATRGPMELYAIDIQLFRARLFRDAGVLRDARKRAELWGYWRRKQELEDAEAALLA